MMAAPVQSYIPEVETEVLGALLSGADFRRVVGLLEERHFVEPVHQQLFAVIRTAFERYNSTTVPVVARLIPEELRSAAQSRLDTAIVPYLARLVADTVAGAPQIEANAKRIVEQWARLAVGEEASRLAAAANDPAANPTTIVASAGQAFDDILSNVRRGPKRKSRTILSDAASEAYAAAEEARQRGSGLTGVTWGLTDVNRLTGGLQRRDLTLLAARPSMGKSTCALSVALRAAKSGIGVGLISLEMDSEKLAARAICDLAYDWNVRVPYADLIRGSIGEKDLERLKGASRDLEGLPLWIEDQPSLSLTDIRVKAEAMMAAAEKAGKPIGVLFVDHLGLIRPSSRYQGNRVNEVAELSAGLKSFAREYGIAVVALSQLSRALESRDNKRPQLSDLRDSGALEQDADTIIFLFREAYYLEREKGGSADGEASRVERLADCQSKLEFHIAKQRNGPIATVDLYCDIACSAVRNGVRV